MVALHIFWVSLDLGSPSGIKLTSWKSKGRAPTTGLPRKSSALHVIFLKEFFIWTIFKVFIEFVYSIVSGFNFFWGVLGHVGS